MPLSRDAQSHALVRGVLDHALQLRQVRRFEIVGLPIDRMVDEIPAPVVPVRGGPGDRRDQAIWHLGRLLRCAISEGIVVNAFWTTTEISTPSETARKVAKILAR